jgi:hypothetical protein
MRDAWLEEKAAEEEAHHYSDADNDQSNDQECNNLDFDFRNYTIS